MRLVRAAGDGLPPRVGRIVEVEAYIGVDDRASHARFGPTARNAPMFGPPGHAYVYLVYGMHLCLNVVTESEGRPAAVLVRAVEPLEGLAAMRAARLTAGARRRAIGRDPDAMERLRRRLERTPDVRLASGPGLVGAAFSLDLALSGADLLDPAGALRLEAAPPDELPPSVRATRRVGIAYAGGGWADAPWRLMIDGHPSVSVLPERA